MTGNSNGPHIEKIMALTEREFEVGCSRLAAPGDSVTPSQAKFSIGSGTVVIRYQAHAAVRLGKQLKLPRAKVTLSFNNTQDWEQADFVSRFDLVFRRGGG